MTVARRPRVAARWLLLAALALTAGSQSAAAQETPAGVVLMYHRFGEDAYPATNIRLEQFEAHLRVLGAGGYTVLPLIEIVAAIGEGRALPDRAVAITVDDAYLSVYREAWPRLRAAGFPFTLFVATAPVERAGKAHMSWDQVRELAAAGVTIGAHSASHAHLTEIEPAAVAEELARSNARFDAELGTVPSLFAYPYGEAGLDVRQAVVAAGYAAAFGQHSGVAHGGLDRFYLPRFAMNEDYGDLDRFRRVIDALPLPASEITPRDPLLKNGRPKFGFTVAEGLEDLDRLACYGSGRGQLRVERLGARRVEVKVKEPFPPGRQRINCTLPAPEGRWRWLGMQFYVPDTR